MVSEATRPQHARLNESEQEAKAAGRLPRPQSDYKQALDKVLAKGGQEGARLLPQGRRIGNTRNRPT
jgi:hypothetical protein